MMKATMILVVLAGSCLAACAGNNPDPNTPSGSENNFESNAPPVLASPDPGFGGTTPSTKGTDMGGPTPSMAPSSNPTPPPKPNDMAPPGAPAPMPTVPGEPTPPAPLH